MTRNHRHKKSYIQMLIILLLFSILTPNSLNTKGNEDLIIDDNIVYISKNITLNGNLIISRGRSLTLINSTLYFNNIKRRGYFLEVMPGGALIVNSSIITGPKDKFYAIFIHHNTTFILYNSTIKNAGWKDQSSNEKYLWIGPAYTNDYSIFGHGLEINTTVTIFRNNILENIASIRFYSSNNIIENNIIKNFRHEGLAFMPTSDNNTIRSNIIVNASSLKRETYGIRFYPGNKDQKIYNNIIRKTVIGIAVSLIPPWITGENFNIYNNSISEVFNALLARLKNSIIHNENYTLMASQGIFIAASQNVVVEKCRIVYLNYCIPEIMDPSYFEEVKRYIHPKYPRAYFNFQVLRRGAIMISWSGRNITLRNNYIAYIPPYGYGIQFDVKYVVYNIYIVNNTLEHIGDEIYVKKPCYIGEPGLGSVRIKNLRRPSGGAIEVEHSQNLTIQNNTIRLCVNGIVTAFPDAIGNCGNMLIKGNILQGIGNSTGEKGIGVGITTRMWRIENKEIEKIYNSTTTISIINNTIYNFYYPIAIDMDQPSLRNLNITQNKIVKYSEIIIPEYVNITENNILIKEPRESERKRIDNMYVIAGEIIAITITIITVMYLVWKKCKV